ncbi:hypothetical protein TrST_g4259 [Triparma strigata]|uniref:ABC transporter domain-containing protein n=1 Tax=Triparma strigata TaxID=1606541 RepID=A0A9W7BJL0_9STRA|nr:hypothetical protein TrST_g4259 [Triparma strigata]
MHSFIQTAACSLTVLLLSLSFQLAYPYEVQLEISGTLPQLCFTSEDIVPKYVNSICQHRDKTYIGGFFNRFGDKSVQHFVVLDSEDKIDWVGNIGINTTLQAVMESSNGDVANAQNASYLGLVNALACPEDEDYIYIGGIFSTVTDDIGEKIANNIVRFDTRDYTFHPIQTLEQLVNNTNIGFTQHCGPDDADDCDDAEQVAMVRSIKCASDGGKRCNAMYVGGYFDKALGTPVKGVARLNISDFENPTVIPVGDEGLDGQASEGVDGLVMTIESIDEDEIVFGGIYDDPSESDVPYLLNRWTEDKGARCVLNRNMLDQAVCQVDTPPLVCCELIFGPVYTTLKLSDTDMLVGGEFINTFDLHTPTGENPADVSEWLTIGYQNIAVVSAKDDAKAQTDFQAESIVGGPDGDVRSLTCSSWTTDSDGSARCAVVYIVGSFNNWLTFTVDTDTYAITKSVLFEAPQHMAKLVYEYNGSLGSYKPEPVFDESTGFWPAFKDQDISVNAAVVTSDKLYFGGDFPSLNNLQLYKLPTDDTAGVSLNIPNGTFGNITSDSEFYDCLVANEATQLSGANFCCRRGSYCPGGLVDIACPDGWGYLCKSESIGVCPEGSYCETAGSEVKCRKGEVCRLGSIQPRECEFWELCPDEGMERPLVISGAILGFFVLGAMFILLIATTRIFSWRKRVGNRDQDKNFHLRYNAFKRNLNAGASNRDRKKSQYEGVSGYEHGDKKENLVDLSSGLGDETEERESITQSLLGNAAPVDIGLPNGDAISVDSMASSSRRELKIDIGFKDLAVELADGKRILNGVTGRLRAGRMTAIMGPSGCGKSTFLSALTNRIRDGGTVLGDISINGQKRPLLSIQHLVGFVPQEDIMHRDLTVRENLRFYAHLKANPNMSRVQRRAFVNEIIDILGLAHVQHSLIGDEETRGISGGQRKRVNIGIELMASPLVLFLDEPTSGLDSTMTQQLIESLDKLAQLGLTIAMVIHQPRYEVLLKIDDLLLLQRGGYPVYVGPTLEALPYFQDFLGSPCPQRTTPADHFLDVISADPSLEHGNVCDSWRWYVENTNGAVSNIEADPEEFVDRVIPGRSRPSRAYQTYAFAKRSFYQTMNTKVAYFTDCVLLVFAGGMVGAVSVEEIQGYQLTMMTAGLISVVSSLKVFGPEKIVFMRETSAGVSTFAYFLGKMLAHLWQISLNPFFFLGLYYRTAYPSVPFFDMYKVILMTQFSCSGLGYLISATVAAKNMQIAGVISGLIAVLLSGLNPTARTLSSFAVGQFGLWCSYGPWTMGSLLIKQTLGSVKALYPVYCAELDTLGYLDIDNSTLVNDQAIVDSKVVLQDQYDSNLNHMFYQYVFYSVLAFFIMSSKAKNASGLMGLDALKYLIKVDVWEPFLNMLKTGRWEAPEELTPREKDERESRIRKSSAAASLKGGTPALSTPQSMASHANSHFSDNTEDTGGTKSIKWGDSKDTTVNEESMKEDELIRGSEGWIGLIRTIGKAKAKALIAKKLDQLQQFENVGAVDPTLKAEKKYEIVKAALLARGVKGGKF